MSCTNPKAAILLPSNDSKTGRKIKFLSALECKTYPELKAKYGDMYIDIPCGKCDSCIEQRTKSWAIRCSLEAAEHNDNCFLTLTYNNQCLPKGGLCKKDFQKFIKHLRNKYGAGIRYFGCGEYGSKYDRPHYHIILFGFWPSDAKQVAPCPYGGSYWTSKELQHLWPFGFVSIGEVSYNSCAYVARYCQKKIKDMGIVRMNPEFCLMSKRPGIGEHYFQRHFKSLMETDRIYAAINQKYVFSSFRYFDKLIERLDPDKLQNLKDQRIRAGRFSIASEMMSQGLPAMEHYLWFKEKLVSEKYNRLKRRLE